MMNELLKRIYNEVISQEKDTVEMGKRLDAEIKKLLQPYAQQFNEQELEIIRGLLYAVELKTEQEAFQLGMSYGLKLFLELTKEL